MGPTGRTNGNPEQADASNRLFARPNNAYHFTFPFRTTTLNHNIHSNPINFVEDFSIGGGSVEILLLLRLSYEKMTTYQIDPDVVRWGLHLIDVCSLSNNGSPETLTCYEKDLSWTESVKEGFCNPTCSFVENDEVIAHALQEELSRIAASDASGFTYAGKQHQEESILAQDWLGRSGFQCNQEEVDKKEAVLTDLEELSLESDYQGNLPEIEDESDIDGELGKRLNQMVPVPVSSHYFMFKINGDIPSADEATSDHQRLLNSSIIVRSNIPDSRASQICERTSSQPALHNYRSGEWGDHVTLQAAADCYGIKIFVITSFKDTCYIEILPQNEKSDRIIFLSFWAEVHYNSIYPLGELPVVEGKKKKRRWWT
ncbi:hypothetical protein DH2020_010594 [Rehmannia glutinosa]|uniref:OTU domain-containing protein n=1 Tax=Rehmannia glutinosa TaxID=99300 RepID=A0ABR0XBS6_REHGL